MARDHARLFTSALADDDWRARTVAAQWLYELLLMQPALTYAGVTDLRISRWASTAADMTTTAVERALAELEEHRFVVIDRTTEEVLVRSYLRRNEVWKQPKLLVLALRQAGEVQSPKLRSALRSELLRLPADPRTGPAKAFAATLPDTPWHTPADTPPETPPDRPTDTPDQTPGDTHAQTQTAGVRAHAGASQPVTSNQEQGTSLPPEDYLGGEVTFVDARAGTNAPPNSNPNPTNPLNCLAHRHLPPDQDPGPCAGCKRARLAAEQAGQAAADAARRAERDRQVAIRECRLCDADGRRMATLGIPGTPPCDHRPLPDQATAEQSRSSGPRAAITAVRAEALRTDCPTCGQPASQRCLDPDTRQMLADHIPAHAARIDAARKVPA